MTRATLLLAAWTLLAGAGIPLVGVLNGGVAKSVGNPFGATAVMFAVATLAALALALPLHGIPTGMLGAPAVSYGAGLLIGFYALSATVIIPRFGAGNFVAFILVAQLLTAAAIDHWALFGMPRHPLDAARLGGMALILAGIAAMQWPG